MVAWNPDRATQFSIVPSHYRVWVDEVMKRWCEHDDDDAMVHCTMAMKRCSIAPSVSRHRAIDFFAHALHVSEKRASDVNIHKTH